MRHSSERAFGDFPTYASVTCSNCLLGGKEKISTFLVEICMVTPSRFELLYGDPKQIRTADFTVKGWCLNRLTMGPCLVAAIRFELMTCRVWTDCSSQLSYAATLFVMLFARFKPLCVNKNMLNDNNII